MGFFSNLFSVTQKKVENDVLNKSTRIVKTILTSVVHTYNNTEVSKLEAYRMALSNYLGCNEIEPNTFLFKGEIFRLDEKRNLGNIVFFLMLGHFEKKLRTLGLPAMVILTKVFYEELEATVLDNDPYFKIKRSVSIKYKNKKNKRVSVN